MNAFLVDLENKPGELARIGETLAAKGINVTGVAGSTCGSRGTVAIMTADDAATRSALRDANCSFKEAEATETSLRDQPGTFAQACRRLADKGVNIEALLPTGMGPDGVNVAFITDNPAKAREVFAQAGSTAR